MWFSEKERCGFHSNTRFLKLRPTTNVVVRLGTALRNSLAECHHLRGIFSDLKKAYNATW